MIDDLIVSMINRANQALTRAYAPYSNYQVACCLYSKEGNFYTGVNVENASYGLSICAESSAICQMIAGGERKIKDLLVMNSENTFCTPCGACRQRIIEFASTDTTVHFVKEKTLIKTIGIDELLPYAFRLKP